MIQRYKDCGDEFEGGCVPDPTGEYILYADHIAALAERDERERVLRDEVEAWRASIGNPRSVRWQPESFAPGVEMKLREAVNIARKATDAAGVMKEGQDGHA